jgi:hypothetical protein
VLAAVVIGSRRASAASARVVSVGQEVAVMVPVPVAAIDDPVPTTMAAVVLVEPVRAENVVVEATVIESPEVVKVTFEPGMRLTVPETGVTVTPLF